MGCLRELRRLICTLFMVRGDMWQLFGRGTSLLNPALRAQPWLNAGLLEQGTALTPGATPAPSLHTWHIIFLPSICTVWPLHIPHPLPYGHIKDNGWHPSWAGGSVLSVTVLFSPGSAQEEIQAVLLLSGFWQTRKPLALCMPKPALGRHLRFHSLCTRRISVEGAVQGTAFTQYVFEY